MTKLSPEETRRVTEIYAKLVAEGDFHEIAYRTPSTDGMFSGRIPISIPKVFTYHEWIAMMEHSKRIRKETRTKEFKASIRRYAARFAHKSSAEILGLTKEELLDRADENYYKSVKIVKDTILEKVLKTIDEYKEQEKLLGMDVVASGNADSV